MTVKLTGADLNAFMTDREVWKDGYWYDDAEWTVDGHPDDLEYTFEDGQGVPPAAKVTLNYGAYYTGSDVGATFYDLESVLRKWLKARTVTVVAVEVPNAEVENFKADLKARKWKVVA